MKFVTALMVSLILSVTSVYSQSDDIAATRQLAEQGDAYAQLHMAYMYQHGKGLPQDEAEAFKWYRKAADQGMPAGQNSLGVMHAEGKVVPQDYLAAYIWFYMAAVQSHDGARESRDEVARNLGAEQVELGQKLAIRCVESGYIDCQFSE